ncbi:hypothetical protein ADUPG1_000293 [Aduncisulcus paluster]|uniref:Uncharacterized protein n=2 Tax=Aduncisulcus paluster TaxID=2918883 RepID=A0ABQ5K5T2_9EUKA|nr:hypothetical protein ADUPG1_000293 [Aduncisulcus paluster]
MSTDELNSMFVNCSYADLRHLPIKPFAVLSNGFMGTYALKFIHGIAMQASDFNTPGDSRSERSRRWKERLLVRLGCALCRRELCCLKDYEMKTLETDPRPPV